MARHTVYARIRPARLSFWGWSMWFRAQLLRKRGLEHVIDEVTYTVLGPVAFGALTEPIGRAIRGPRYGAQPSVFSEGWALD
jgi:hypothetical protein